MSARRSPARDLALIALFAGLIAVLGLPGTINLFGSSVPITAQTLGVMLAGSILGARRGTLAVIVLLALVAAGLPLLAGGRGGIGVFLLPSAGYLLAWPLGAWVTGWLTEKVLTTGRYSVPVGLVANVTGGIGIVYLIGLPVMVWLAKAPWLAGLIFVPGDLLKAVVATVVAKGVHAGYPVLAREVAIRVEERRERREHREHRQENSDA